MHALGRCCGALLTLCVAVTTALDGIVAPDQVTADTDFQVTFQNGNSDKFRVYLAAALAGTNGPACYLENSTTLTSPMTLNIPASVGPSADYYTIAIGDITTGQGATFSNRFNLTNATGQYTEYEDHLGGAEFWDANDLPCSAYSCARDCAQASYPDDLTQTAAYDTMKQCIQACPGVSASPNQTSPVHASSASSASGTAKAVSEALVTLAPGVVMTAIETFTTKGSSTIEEAILGSVTLTLGGSAATISSKAVSLASSGIEVGASSTVPFTSVVESAAVTTSVSDDSKTSTGAASAAATSNPAVAGRDRLAGAGAAVGALVGLALLI